MKIAKPLLLIATPIGVAGAVTEAFRVAGGLGFLLVALLLMVGIAIGTVVLTVRQEKAAGNAGPPAGSGGEGST